MNQCVQCEKSDEQVPLLQFLYRGEVKFICPQCLPVLIHKPANMAAKLPGVENLPPPSHEH